MVQNKSKIFGIYSILLAVLLNFLFFISHSISVKKGATGLSLGQAISLMEIIPWISIILLIAVLVLGIMGLIKALKEENKTPLVLCVIGLLIALVPLIIGIVSNAVWFNGILKFGILKFS